MVCLAVLRHCPSPSWQGAFFAHVHAHMGAFNPQELANVLTAAGAPGCGVCDMPSVTDDLWLMFCTCAWALSTTLTTLDK